MDHSLPTPAQIRAGRALVGWSQQDLAAGAGTSRRTVASFELGMRVSEESVSAMAAALARVGVEFTDRNGAKGVERRDPS